MSQDYIQRLVNSKNSFKSKYILEQKRARSEDLVKKAKRNQYITGKEKSVRMWKQGLIDRLLHLLMLETSADVGYKLALRLINKPF